MDLAYSVIRSSRRTLSLEIRPDGSLLVRSPKRLSDRAIREFVTSRETWIRQKLQKFEGRPGAQKLTAEELETLKKQAAGYFSRHVQAQASRVGVSFGRITIRAQKTRWGSCSARGNLNFNCLLMLAPEPVREYVVCHELCHRKHMNHSAAFWAEVARVCPDYALHRQWLKENGASLLARLEP